MIQAPPYIEHERILNKLNYAVRMGYVPVAGRCQQCACNKPLVGHHSDYSKPLVVTWLCRRCHSRTHNPTWNARVLPSAAYSLEVFPLDEEVECERNIIFSRLERIYIGTRKLKGTNKTYHFLG